MVNTQVSDSVLHLRPRNGSPTRTISTFIPENLLPEDITHIVQQAAAQMSLRPDSDIDSAVFPRGEESEEYTEHTRVASSPEEHGNDGNYDLKPPPPSVSLSNAESLSEQLFSAEHLNLILLDRSLCARFNSFLNKHRPHANPVLARYQTIQKAKAAIQYANAIAESLPGLGPSFSENTPAAILDHKFESRAQEAVDELLNDALPSYVTHRLVGVVTECLVKEITGNNAPIMRELVPGLAEVYCLTDPSLPDNPIVYASEEFYKTTQYGREYVIGRNCRFLQGPKSSQSSVKRLIDALAEGKEVCETILNYRRDGSPFINLLMIAPLYDNKGRVRYFIGCQIDVTNLVDGGRGLESFQRLIAQDRSQSRFGPDVHKSSLSKLCELGQQLNQEELNTVRNSDLDKSSGRETPPRPSTARRRLGLDDSPSFDNNLWPSAFLGPSGRLPGVYQNYLLVRPYPSLRITFTSPALRFPGLVQSRFMDRVVGPQHIREGILDALTQGVGVTARISWLTHSGPRERKNLEGKPRWVHCTPLLGSDEKVGVWMIVMIENEEITGSLNAREAPLTHRTIMSPIRSPSPTGRSRDGRSLSGRKEPMSISERYGSAKLYAQYLREGKAGGSSAGTRSRNDSARDSHSLNRTVPYDTDEGI